MHARIASRLIASFAGITLVFATACGGTAQGAAQTSMVTDAQPISTLPLQVSEATPRVPVVVLDPGHAVDESGAAAYGIVEKDSNLDMAQRIADILRQRGVEVLLTHTADVRAAAPGDEPTQETGYNGTRLDLQARVDIANAAHADVFVSLHSNGAGDPAVRGHEVYYNAARPFAAANKALAGLLLDGVTAELSSGGFPSMPRGVIDDDCLKAFQGRCFPLFVLGPVRVTDREEVYRRGGTPEGLGFMATQLALTSRATQMPGALVELMFISSPDDAALLRDESARDAMARGVARGITEFLASGRQGG